MRSQQSRLVNDVYLKMVEGHYDDSLTLTFASAYGSSRSRGVDSCCFEVDPASFNPRPLSSLAARSCSRLGLVMVFFLANQLLFQVVVFRLNTLAHINTHKHTHHHKLHFQYTEDEHTFVHEQLYISIMEKQSGDQPRNGDG